jgi:PIN domain nuclease of toxin-antitoxin system
MRVLLDTHTFLWWNMDAPQLSTNARDIIASGRAEIFISAATAWELSIKARKGRLILPAPPAEYINERIAHYHFIPLPVLISHASQTFLLPDHHADPFDRLLVAQCQVENMALLSAENQLRAYTVEVIW